MADIRDGGPERLADDPDYRLGYEYAQKNRRFWEDESAEGLLSIAGSCHELYEKHKYRQVLGMAAFLRELAAKKLAKKAGGMDK